MDVLLLDRVLDELDEDVELLVIVDVLTVLDVRLVCVVVVAVLVLEVLVDDVVTVTVVTLVLVVVLLVVVKLMLDQQHDNNHKYNGYYE